MGAWCLVPMAAAAVGSNCAGTRGNAESMISISAEVAGWRVGELELILPPPTRFGLQIIAWQSKRS